VTDAPPGRPNVVVVVLDCVRADDFPGTRPGGAPHPFLEELRQESVVFPRATSVAPWTVPSHATIFTGLYPWEHGAHAKGTLPLPSTIPRLPSLLRSAGYASLCLSANPLLNPELGLVDGFDAAAWSEWWEPYMRNSPGARTAKRLVRAGSPAATPSSRLQRLHDSPLVSLLHRSANLVYRYPFAVSAGNHLAQRVTDPEAADHALVARWIDPTFESWTRGVATTTPVFAFVNLLEAHEPYFVDREVVRGLGAYWRYVRTWQDRPSVLSGAWTPTPDEVALLRALYRGTFRLLEERLRRLIGVLKATGRWENTLFVVTSDHGQAFLENGTLFHMHRPDEGLLRVPLWVRYPGGARGGTVARGWASLLDVAPTVLDAAGLPTPPAMSGRRLPDLEGADRPDPVFAMADGLALAQERRQIAAARIAWIDRSWVAAYEGDRKVTYDLADGRLRAYDLHADPEESADEWPRRPGEFEPLAAAARRVADRLTGGPDAAISEEVEDRLRSWGYV
jgi:arylsulfatase A-like enzyme